MSESDHNLPRAKINIFNEKSVCIDKSFSLLFSAFEQSYFTKYIRDINDVCVCHGSVGLQTILPEIEAFS